ncbi:hypothetical protein BJP25_16150 [Actinokineospora bangkokensis]|uniref:Polyketide synthase n=1 Tax=Actinokineospora bangkokensis TaxID=1193682 RepID=A0A1Q9LP49_9PSEU|nr:type I polyketide synthase [Actinokineospora bangkokensis]OLR93774.1 hypothetical protein BJP25_16150 [Actinokineospora bangkokensis]
MSEEKLRHYLKRVTADLHTARARVRELEARGAEPVAVVGMSCRFPGGATSPERLWDLVARGGDAVTAFPADRGWDTAELLGLGAAPVGGFLPDATDFDAGFFGISPREALAVDPQQRLALECSWEALERAGVNPADLRGSDTAVFMGTNGQDYPQLVTSSADAEDVVGHVATGSAASVLSGRVSYALGFEGPSVTVDTACSSSLVALHWAVQALRRGECSLALAGGVTVMATTGVFTEFAHQGALAADGRCKAFSDDADGTGWGEGAGVLVLERLSDAERLGHRVLAVVRGSAVNSDGASSSLTAPNGPSQQRVILRALADAGLGTSDVDLVEAHGTGTRLGDPIEAQALLATYGQNRAEPLWLGSVKSNIGHTQAAAGVAGVIKVVEAMRHGVLPATLHVGKPSSEVDWESGAVEVLDEARAWAVDRPRRAGVSSFGISGTNAHVILEQGPDAHPAEPTADTTVPWVFSAREPAALAAQAEQLAQTPGSAIDIGWSLASTRAHFEERAVVVGQDRDEVLAGLAAPMVRGRASGEGRVAVVFSGQGAQRAGMGERLYQRFPVFARALDEVCAHFDLPVRHAMTTGDGLDRTDLTQAALFAHEVAAYRLLQSWGLRPTAVMGHSIGEVVAAHVAGVWSLADACTLVAARGKLMAALPAGGAMVAVEATEDEVTPLLTPGVSVAAVNGPRSIVLSGVEAEVLAVAGRLTGRRSTRLPVSHAFHSPLVDPVLPGFREVVAGLAFRPPRLPVLSNLTGRPVTTELADPDYWVRHVRAAVRFADGVRALAARGADAVLEIGPKAVLAGAVREITGLPVAAVARRDVPEDKALLSGVGALWVEGVEVDWPAVFGGLSPQRVDLPTYPFQRSRYWPATAAGTGDELRYEVAWAPVAIAAGPLSGTWAVLAGSGVDTSACVEALAARGAHAVACGPNDLGSVQPAGVVVLAGEAADPVKDMWTVADLARRAIESGARVWVVTTGGAAVADEPVSPTAAGVWGLGRVIGLEHPGSWGGLVDVAEGAWDRVAEVVAAGEEREVAVRVDGVFARRVVPQVLDGPASAPDVAGGTALITGGTGALGLRAARWLAERGVARVVLVGRTGARTPEVDALAEAHPRLEVETRACDVSDAAAVRALVAGCGPLRAVVHAAGVVADVPFAELGEEAFDLAVRAKVRGAAALHEATLDQTLDLYLTFSSISATWGAGGQAAYAAANAFLDGLVARRRAAGLPGTSVAWGPWGGGGMVAAEGSAQTLAERGLRLLRPETAIAALSRSVDHGRAHSVVADVDWERLAGVFDAVGASGLFTEVRPMTTRDTTGVAQPASGLAALPPEQRPVAVEAMVREQVAAVLGHAGPGSIVVDRPFRDLGFDSLTAVEFRDRFRAASGLPLGATAVYDHPTPQRLVEHVLDLLAPAERTAAAVTAATDEPIAIVGTACRLPGGITGPDQLWALVEAGGEVAGPFPTDRGWDPGLTGSGGFLDDAAGFDAAFFGISPREALAMDPQQRLVLECAWEALERAGIDPTGLRGTDSGVFLGLSHIDYGPRLHEPAENTEGYLLTGSAQGVASGRVAYVLGLEGPAVSLDTACSSSLVALHWAAQSLRRGECGLALVGGVAVMSTPGAFSEFERQGGLAADGRCKAFADEADGTGWSEGVGVLAVERLSDARRLGHPVLAVVRGSAINSDGASNGLTAPNGPAQQRVIRRALADAGLRPGDVDLVEAHGTGTALGDPIEAQAVLATYGRDRDGAAPLRLGSLKSNLGHAQAAAGVVGVIKVVEAMRHGVLPRTLHAANPSSHVDWSAGEVDLLTEAVAWDTGRPRRAGVSAFGLSGTNAHVILEQAPEPAPEPEPGPVRDAVVPWVLSARGAGALDEQAARLMGVGGSAVDVGWSLATGRAVLDERAIVVGAHHAELKAGLGDLVVRGRAEGAGRVGVVFSGQGAQRPGMGLALAARFPVFAEALAQVCGHFGIPVADAMATGEGLDHTEMTQAALFAYEVALFRLIESWGVRPAVVMGHSIGEVAAAHVAGVLSLADACALVAARGRLMGALPAGGVMVSITATEDEVAPLLTRGVAIAAVNGPRSVVVSGEQSAVDAVVGHFPGRRVKRLTVSHAFHSPLMDPVLDDFRRVAETLDYRLPAIPVVSNLTGAHATHELTDPGYWVRHVRGTVRFADGVAAVAGEVDAVLEIGPRGVLSAAVREVVDATRAPEDAAVVVAPLSRDALSEDRALLLGLGRAWVSGVAVDWGAVFAGLGARRTDLPTYAFQHERFWLNPGPAAAPAEADGEFWDAVHRLDSRSLAQELGVDAAALAAVLPALSTWRRRGEDHASLDRLRYRAEWVPIAPPPAAAAGSRWLVVVDDDSQWLGSRVTATMAARGMRHQVLAHNGGDRAALASALRATGGGFDGVLSLLGTGDAHDRGPDTGLLTAGLTLFQALGDAGVRAPLWCATRDAVGPEDGPGDPGRSALWGLGRCAALEEPRRWGGMVDLPTTPAGYHLDRLCDVISAPAADDQVVLRAHTTYGRRLTAAPARPAPAWRPRGTVLVSGGTGAVGEHVARWLAGRGAEHLLLLNRTGTAPAWVDELGAEVTVAACDVADETRLREVLAAIPEDRPLRAVFHAAGVLDDGVLAAMTPRQLTTAMAPKALGAWNLHRLTSGLDRFVVFSSVAATWGNAGQANYAAANAYLDGLVRHRHALGLPGSSVAWGPWGEGGMANDAAVAQRMARAGMAALHPRQALGVLEQVVASGEPALTAIDVEWERFAAQQTATRPTRLFERLVEAAPQGESASQRELGALKPAELRRVLLHRVRETAAAVLGHGSSGVVAPRQRFADLGFDSLTAVELRNGLTAETGLELPATLVFDFPTPVDLAAELERLLAEARAAEDGHGGDEAAGGGEGADEDGLRLDGPSLEDEFESMSADELIHLALGDDR